MMVIMTTMVIMMMIKRSKTKYEGSTGILRNSSSRYQVNT